jgi:hypothetical protein
MAYVTGGRIDAEDFAQLIGTVAAHGPEKLNTIWSSGYNNSGYGQTAIPLPATFNQVTATQWATAINALNNTYYHQTGSGSGLAAPTAGTPVTYLRTLQSSIQTAYANRLSTAASSGASGSASYSFNITADWNQSGQGYGIRTLTWSSGDAARYFFNAHGIVGITVTSIINNNGTSRSQSIVTLGSNFQQKSFGSMTAAARSGSGGNVTNDITDKGYYQLTTTPFIFTSIDSTSYYNSDYMLCRFSTNGTQGSLGDNGNQLTLGIEFNSPAVGNHDGPYDDTLDVTVNYNLFWIYPSTLYLSTSWGTVIAA